jgi:SAM-dependent methyltransferase
MGRLGIGDLHPGGREASRFLLAELSKHRVKQVLEVGAGIGNTTELMMRSGLEVTSLEPNPILHKILTDRLRIAAGSTPFEDFEDADGSYDAVISESVFYALDLPRTLEKTHRLLRRGGLFGFAEMLWTEAAKSDVVAFIHDRTKQMFGIPMAPREPTTAAKWGSALRAEGFSEVATMSLDPASRGEAGRGRRLCLALALLRHPSLLPSFLTYRSYQQLSWAPSHWLEERVAVWRRN